MKILNAEQIRSWDQYTIEHERISSIELMERAARKCVDWLEAKSYTDLSICIFCGKGNNGGDGLAIARLLATKGHSVKVYILEFGHLGTEDFQTNLARLHEFPTVDIRFLQTKENFHHFERGDLVIDALFGSGLNRGLEKVTAELVDHINASGCEVIAIDIPSGMFVDRTSGSNTIIKASHTLSFQCYKPSFLIAENSRFIGDVHILDIGLDPGFYESLHSQFELIDPDTIHSIYKPRNRFAHKGNFGHALLVAGSYGKIGAALLAAKACLRSGPGLLTCHIPACGYDILQTALPEAMIITDENATMNTKLNEDLVKYDGLGVGPGIGLGKETASMLKDILNAYRSPTVIDADALNILSSQEEWLKLVPPGSILTPHPREFDRLFGDPANDFERIEIAAQRSQQMNVIIILKGHHTFIATPAKGGAENPSLQGYFNSTGNAGMATGGSGDVLTGILTGLLAQGYNSVDAALLGVYIHGMAGDFAASIHSPEAMIAGDITESLGKAFFQIQSKNELR